MPLPDIQSPLLMQQSAPNMGAPFAAANIHPTSALPAAWLGENIDNNRALMELYKQALQQSAVRDNAFTKEYLEAQPARAMARQLEMAQMRGALPHAEQLASELAQYDIAEKGPEGREALGMEREAKKYQREQEYLAGQYAGYLAIISRYGPNSPEAQAARQNIFQGAKNKGFKPQEGLLNHDTLWAGMQQATTAHRQGLEAQKAKDDEAFKRTRYTADASIKAARIAAASREETAGGKPDFEANFIRAQRAFAAAAQIKDQATMANALTEMASSALAITMNKVKPSGLGGKLEERKLIAAHEQAIAMMVAAGVPKMYAEAAVYGQKGSNPAVPSPSVGSSKLPPGWSVKVK